MKSKVKISNSVGSDFTSLNSARRLVARGNAKWKILDREIEILPRPAISTRSPFPIKPSLSVNGRFFGSSEPAKGESRRSASRLELEASASGSHTEAEWREVVARYGNKCLRCEASGDVVTLAKDHVTPLAQGGINFASNLQPLCGPCNSWKGNRDIDFRGRNAYASPPAVAA